ncbi:MAG: Crp/Fnr family transcriptional regulator [Magnetospirillum sp.]|nr:Crp/Fnr family transcriptional regulator [Magnetospirillum sp.]
MGNVYGEVADCPAWLLRFGSLRPATVHRGQVLFACGMPVTRVHFVGSGYVALVSAPRGKRVVLDVIGPGGVVDPESVVGGVHGCAAEAISDASLCSVDVGELSRALQDGGELASHFVEAMARRARVMGRQLVTLKCYSCRERLALFLIGLASAQGSQTVVVLPFDKSVLASWLGMTREALSRTFLALREAGVTVRKTEIVFRDFSALCRMVSG